MEKVLDIDDIIGARGFVASSSDDDEEVAQLSKAKSDLGARLANLFAEDSSNAPMALDEGSNLRASKKHEAAPLSTFFSTTVFLYLHRDGQYVSKGRCGVAVMKTPTSNILIFYNSNKEAILCVTLGEAKISKIEKRQKHCMVSCPLKAFSFICLNSNDEAKLVALLMILCNIESTILEEGEGEEVKMSSSVLCDSTTFNFDGSSIELSTERDSKLRLSTKSEPFDLLLLGMKRNEKRIIRIDQKTAVLFHVKKVKISSSKKKDEATESSALSQSSLDQSTVDNVHDLRNDRAVKEVHSEHNLRQRMAMIGQPILPDLDLLHHTNALHKGEHVRTSPAAANIAEQPVHNGQEMKEASLETPQNSERPCSSQVADNEEKVGTVCEVLNDYSVLHRIVGVEIDRMEIRLEAALERMVDRHFQSFAEEIRNVKSTQEAILNKLDELTKTRGS